MFCAPHTLPIENIIRLYGIHETYLNQLVSRYDEELIPCLLKHFNEPNVQGMMKYVESKSITISTREDYERSSLFNFLINELSVLT